MCSSPNSLKCSGSPSPLPSPPQKSAKLVIFVLYIVILWLSTVSTPLALHMLSPVSNYSTSSKMVCFFSVCYGDETWKSSTAWRSLDIMHHVYQGFPPILLFNDCLHSYLCILSSVVNYSASNKMVLFFSWHYWGETSNSSLLGSDGYTFFSGRRGTFEASVPYSTRTPLIILYEISWPKGRRRYIVWRQGRRSWWSAFFSATTSF